jgi:hypothetical protein
LLRTFKNVVSSGFHSFIYIGFWCNSLKVEGFECLHLGIGQIRLYRKIRIFVKMRTNLFLIFNASPFQKGTKSPVQTGIASPVGMGIFILVGHEDLAANSFLGLAKGQDQRLT